MPDPEHVNHPRFPVTLNDVLFNQGGNSIAISTFDGQIRAVGTRWNYAQGGGGTGIGFPNSRGRASWYILPRAQGIALLRGLLVTDFPGKDESRIRAAIEELLAAAGEEVVPSDDV